MSNYKTVKDFFEDRGPADLERFVDKNLDISQQVLFLLKEKGWSQHDLAQKLGKSDAEISKWLSGSHNLTLRSITKMEAILGADIILTPSKMNRKRNFIIYGTITASTSLVQNMGRNTHFNDQVEITPDNLDHKPAAA